MANLLGAERDDSDQCEVFEGETCVEEFLDWLREQTNTNDPQEKRQVIAVAHNFQGYDSYFYFGTVLQRIHLPRSNCQWCQNFKHASGAAPQVYRQHVLLANGTGQFCGRLWAPRIKEGVLPPFLQYQSP